MSDTAMRRFAPIRSSAAWRTVALRTSAAVLLGAAPLAAQQGQAPRPPVPAAAASSIASVEVRLSGRVIAGRWFPTAAPLAGPAVIRIEYGQPHARGRSVMGGTLVPMDSVWRFGANLATHLTTDVDLDIGGTTVPRGTYTLFALPSASGWKLIVNRQTGQWGTDYDARADLARVNLQQRTLAEPLESFTVWLVPNVSPQGQPPEPASGVLRFAWERTELSVPWRVVLP
jgi:hypothetical protein